MTSDLEEREKALDPSQSFIVQAPAGSGKTGLLTQRFLRLLAVVEKPESVVAITFTRKAAAEMRERIIQALEDAASDKPVESEYEKSTRVLAQAALAQSRSEGWNLLADSARLQVFTIDALCALLTRHMPVLSGFGGEVEVVEDASELRRMAARRTLQKLTEGDEECRKLFRDVILYFDNNTAALETQIMRMLEKRDQWAFLKSDEHSDLVKSFCRLLAEARIALNEIFREQRKVDFGEITDAAIRALGTPENPTDLLYWLDYRIQHLLMDEFQDTSRAQYKLVEALTAQWSGDDDHSLFLVGDPMQSIYRFREAEVSLFLRCWQEQMLGAVRLERVTLATNFRSTPGILGWVTKTFSKAMLDADNPCTGSVQFRASEPARTDAGISPQYHWFVDDGGSDEAARVAEIVRRAQSKGAVAILVRSRSHIVRILPALRDAGLGYQAVEIDRLFEQQHVLDIISLTRAILHVGDRVAWLACLRAPWCGLRLADLAALAEGKHDKTIFDLISDPEVIAQLSGDGRSRVIRVREILSAAVANAGRIRLRGLVESTWLALGGPSMLPAHQCEDVETVLDLIEKEEQGGVIRDFSLLDERLEFLFAKPAATENCVQVMTVYTAKGLEFDTVILPQLYRTTQSLEKDLLIWAEELSDDGGLQLRIAAMPQSGKPDEAYDSVRESLKEKEEHELKRVFYVACTRAKNELHLLSSSKSKKDGSGCYKASSGTFLNLIWDEVKPEFESILRRRRGQFDKTTAAGSPETPLWRLPEGWRLPAFENSVRWQAPVRPDTASLREPTFEWVRGNARHVGIVVHALLNRICGEGLGAWNGAKLRNSSKLIASELAVRGVPADEITKAAQKVAGALTNTLESSKGRWILSGHAAAQSEYAIRGRIQDKLISGVVDRMFRDEHGRLWIIDYKTGEHRGGSRDEFLNEEQRRYRPQLESYATLISRLESGPIMLGLYFPLMDGWREWEFAEEAALTASSSADYTGG